MRKFGPWISPLYLKIRFRKSSICCLTLVVPPSAGDPGTTPVPSNVILNETVSSPIRLNWVNVPFFPCTGRVVVLDAVVVAVGLRVDQDVVGADLRVELVVAEGDDASSSRGPFTVPL